MLLEQGQPHVDVRPTSCCRMPLRVATVLHQRFVQWGVGGALNLQNVDSTSITDCQFFANKAVCPEIVQSSICGALHATGKTQACAKQRHVISFSKAISRCCVSRGLGAEPWAGLIWCQWQWSVASFRQMNWYACSAMADCDGCAS